METSGDCCLSMFAAVWATGQLPFPLGARVLEIGCAEADWMTPMLAERPDLQITGVDVRRCDRPGTVIVGDVLTQAFPEAAFDAVVGVSSLEHIGLGHYGDPLDRIGDAKAVALAARWLKPGGWLYADVPYGADYRVVGTSHRQYDDRHLAERIVGPLTERQRWYFDAHGEPSDPSGAYYVAVLATKDA